MLTLPDALSIINQKIKEIKYPEDPAGLYDPMAYLLALKGKKIRPSLTLLACNLYRNRVHTAINAALAWEIFHNFTLMHDDVMDKADLRRGQPTVHKKWNENTAILSGDAMLILSYICMNQSPQRKLKSLLDLFSQTASDICRGQQYDMEFEKRLDVSEDEYIRMIYLKTAVLLGACLKSGAMIGNANLNDQQYLYDFGINLGIAFQIKDDVLDTYGNPAVFGKKIGGDIVCNKKTYLLVNALNAAQVNEKEELLRWIRNSSQSEKKIEAVRNIYNRLNIKEKSQNTIQSFYQKAMNALQSVSVKEEKKVILKNLAQDLMERES